MGIEYLSPDEILKNKNNIHKKFEKQSYFIRSGILEKYIIKNIKKNKDILEVGCSIGRFAETLLNNNFKNINLIDIDNYVDENILNKVNFKKCDISFNKLPFKDNSLDLILAIAIVEHLENPFLFFREANRVLKNNGQLIIAIPHIFNLRSRLKFLFSGDLFGYTKNNNHISVFTKTIFNKIVLEKFFIINTIYSEGFIRIPFLNKKIRLKNNTLFDYWFGTKTLYILRKKQVTP